METYPPAKLYIDAADAPAAAAIPAPGCVCIAAWKRCVRCSLVDISSAAILSSATPKSLNKVHMLLSPMEVMIKYHPGLIDADEPHPSNNRRGVLKTLWEHPLFEMVYELITGTPESTFVCRIQATQKGEIMQMTLGMNPSKVHLMASVWPFSCTKDWSPDAVRALGRLVDRWQRIDLEGAKGGHMLKCISNPRHHLVAYKSMPLAKIHKINMNVFRKSSRTSIVEAVSNMDNAFFQTHVFHAATPPGETLDLPLDPIDAYMIRCPDALTKNIRIATAADDNGDDQPPVIRLVATEEDVQTQPMPQPTRVLFFHKANIELYIELLHYWTANRVGRYPWLVIVCAKDYIPIWEDLVAKYISPPAASFVQLVYSMTESCYSTVDPKAMFILHNIIPVDARRLAKLATTQTLQHFFVVSSERFVQWKYLTHDVYKTMRYLVPPSGAPVCAPRLLAALTAIWRPTYATNGPMTFIDDCNSSPNIRMIMIPSIPAIHTCAVHDTSVVSTRLSEHADLMDKDNLCNLLYPPFYETTKSVKSVFLSHINPYAHGPVHYRLCAKCKSRWVNTRDADHCYKQAEFADRVRVCCMVCVLLKYSFSSLSDSSSSMSSPRGDSSDSSGRGGRQKHELVYRRSYGWDLVPADISTFFNALLYNTIIPALKNPKNTNMIYIVFHNSSEITDSMNGIMRTIFESVLCSPVETPVGPMTRTRIKQLDELARGTIPVPAFFPDPAEQSSSSDIDIISAPCDPVEFRAMIGQRICGSDRQRRLTLLLVDRKALKHVHLYNVFNTRLRKVFVYGYSPILQFLPSVKLCTRLTAMYYYVPSPMTAVDRVEGSGQEEENCCRCISDQLVDMKKKRMLLSKMALVQLGGERQMSYPNWAGSWVKRK